MKFLQTFLLSIFIMGSMTSYAVAKTITLDYSAVPEKKRKGAFLVLYKSDMTQTAQMKLQEDSSTVSKDVDYLIPMSESFKLYWGSDPKPNVDCTFKGETITQVVVGIRNKITKTKDFNLHFYIGYNPTTDTYTCLDTQDEV